MEHKVRRVIAEKPIINAGNLKNDKAGDLMKFYGLSERQMQQQVRMHIGDASEREQKKEYHKIYGKKE